MKKLFAILSVITALCLATSCGNVNTQTNASESTNDTVSTQNTTSKPIFQTTQDTTIISETGGDNSNEELASWCIEDYDEYDTLVNASTIPTDFLTYEKVSFIGEFESFICPIFASLDECDYYIYTLRDTNEYSIMISIKPTDDELVAEDDILISESPSDYRSVSREGVVRLIVDGSKYTYVAGRLSSIEMIYGGISIAITGEGMLYDYPTDGEETFISRLLAPSKASTALSEFSSSIVTE